MAAAAAAAAARIAVVLPPVDSQAENRSACAAHRSAVLIAVSDAAGEGGHCNTAFIQISLSVKWVTEGVCTRLTMTKEKTAQAARMMSQ